MSLVEVIANNAIAFAISVVANFMVLPMFGLNVKFSQSIAITLIFTCISIIRGYLVRRFFESLSPIQTAIHRYLRSHGVRA